MEDRAMTALVVLAILSANIIVLGLHFLKGICEEVYRRLTEESVEDWKPSLQEIVLCAAGIALGVYSAVLYYQVCASTVENIVVPHHPVEEPVPFGISLLITSLTFAGGWGTALIIIDSGQMRVAKICTAASAVLLLVYLTLKGAMVLP